MARKPRTGQRKIQIKRMEDEDARQVTFSKRRLGFYKKANELGFLCGSEAAIIAFSPAGKAFSFGNPIVDKVIDLFLGKSLSESGVVSSFIDIQRKARTQELGQQYDQLMDQLEDGKKRKEMLLEVNKAKENTNWWEAPVENLGRGELVLLGSAVEQLKNNLANCAVEVMQDTSFPSYFQVMSMNSIEVPQSLEVSGPSELNGSADNGGIVPYESYGIGFGGNSLF